MTIVCSVTISEETRICKGSYNNMSKSEKPTIEKYQLKRKGSNRYLDQIVGSIDCLPEQSRIRNNKLSVFQMCGWNLTPQIAISRLFSLHQLAVNAEVDGRVAKADFYLKEFRNQLRREPKNRSIWIETFPPKKLPNGQAIRPVIVREYFIDSHLGLANGFQKIGEFERAEKHFQFARDLFDESNLTSEEQDHLILQHSRFEIERLKAKSNWEEALSKTRKAAKENPDNRQLQSWLGQDYQDAVQNRIQAQRFVDAADFVATFETAKEKQRRDLISSLVEKAIVNAIEDSSRGLNGETSDILSVAKSNPKSLDTLVNAHVVCVKTIFESVESQKPREWEYAASTINAHVKSLNLIRKAEPNCYPTYEALGFVNHLAAVAFANGGRPSEALLHVEKALSYIPEWGEAEETRSEVERLMQSLVEQTKDIRSQIQGLRRQGNVGDFDDRRILSMSSIPREAIDLYMEAKSGTSARDEFRKSGEPKQIRKKKQEAKSRWLWLLTGLPIPKKKKLQDATKDLENAIEGLSESDLANFASFDSAWQKTTNEKSNLADLGSHAELVFDFLKQDAVAAATDTEELVQELFGVDEEVSQATDETDQYVPFIKIEKKPTPTNENYVPLSFWFLSWRGLLTKAAMIAAIGVGAFAGFVHLSDKAAQSERDLAFKDLVEATGDLDNKRAESAITRFKVAKPWAETDLRSRKVASIESDLSKWPDMKARNKSYMELIDAVKNEDDEIAVKSANAYLSLTMADDDARYGQVVELHLLSTDIPKRKIRNLAFDKLKQASKEGEEKLAIDQAELFLSSLTDGVLDERTLQVKQSYQASFVDWVVHEPKLTSLEIEKVAQDLKTLTAEFNQKGSSND